MKSERPHGLRRLFEYSRSWRSRIHAAIACSVLNKVFDLAPPILIGAAVDTVVLREESFLAGLGYVDVMDQLVVLSVLTVVVWGLESAFEYAYKLLWRNLAQRIQHALRVDAYGHVQEVELSWFHRRSMGGLMAVLNDDINQLERFLDEGANDLLQIATTAVVISAGFFIVAPSVAWMAMLPIPFIIWGSLRFQRLLAPRYAAVRERVEDVNRQLANNLGGIATIKSYATEEHEVERIRALSATYREANRDAIAFSSAFTPLIRMLIVVGFVATLVYGGHLVLDDAMAVGTYSVLVFMTQRLLWPLTRLGRTLDLYQRAMASTHRVMDVLGQPIGIVSGTEQLECGEVRGVVSLEKLRFSYNSSEVVLDDISLEIPAGATVGIVGATGSGKSTLVHLLLRFYEPDRGTIRLDGQDISELELRSLRRAVGLVSQQTYLFSGPLIENVRYGSFDATEAEVLHALELAEAMEFVERLPEGVHTHVGERGETLSGGQQQRLSIARALLKDPPVLVLDEATSAVDNETEAALQRSLERITEYRTTLIIAHRLSTVRNADFIVVLERGRLLERGTHEELLAADGYYARLWRVQTGERIAAGERGSDGRACATGEQHRRP